MEMVMRKNDKYGKNLQLVGLKQDQSNYSKSVIFQVPPEGANYHFWQFH